MHRELASYGIQVATLNPGPFGTGFNETSKMWSCSPREARSRESVIKIGGK
jgi:hypothetical protein